MEARAAGRGSLRVPERERESVFVFVCVCAEHARAFRTRAVVVCHAAMSAGTSQTRPYPPRAPACGWAQASASRAASDGVACVKQLQSERHQPPPRVKRTDNNKKSNPIPVLNYLFIYYYSFIILINICVFPSRAQYSRIHLSTPTWTPRTTCVWVLECVPCPPLPPILRVKTVYTHPSCSVPRVCLPLINGSEGLGKRNRLSAAHPSLCQSIHAATSIVANCVFELIFVMLNTEAPPDTQINVSGNNDNEKPRIHNDHRVQDVVVVVVV